MVSKQQKVGLPGIVPDSHSIDVVVCHYNRAGSASIRYMALHAMACLCADCPDDLNTVLVDGSPERDEELAAGLCALNVEYVHCGRELSFGATYNEGIRRTSSPVVVTLANDILVTAAQIRKLAADIRGHVGCVSPYLTFSDYGAQRQRRLPLPTRCFPTRTTLNVNAFSREALERVGLIPEHMSGCYNDVILFIKLREAGYSLVLRNAGRVIHLGQQTLKTGATSVDYDADATLFGQEYPHYWRKGTILFHKVAQRRMTRLMYGILESLPKNWVDRLRLWEMAWAVEPYLCAERGTFRKGFCRLFGLRRAPRAPGACSTVASQWRESTESDHCA